MKWALCTVEHPLFYGKAVRRTSLNAVIAFLFVISVLPSSTVGMSPAETIPAVRVGSQGIITTVAGDGVAGYNGDDQLSTTAQLNAMSGIGVAVDRAGDLYIADTNNHRIRRVDTLTRRITTIVGDRQQGYRGDNGLATTARLNHPNAIAVADDGTLYIADTDNEVVRRVDPRTHIITTIVGMPGQHGFQGDGGLATRAQMRGPVALLLTDNDSTLYVADLDNHVVRAINLQSHRITTVAGVINTGSRVEGRDFKGDGGPATRALMAGVYGLAVDQQGNLYIADTNNGVVRRVDAHTHIITTVAGHYAGTFAAGYSGDGGAATSAQLNNPTGLAVNEQNELYIADGGNHVIRQVDLKTGIITTIIGSGMTGDSGDGGPARQAAFQEPRSLYLEANGQLYIGDMKANRVRAVRLSGVISNPPSSPSEPCPSNATLPSTSKSVGGQYAVCGMSDATFEPALHNIGLRCNNCVAHLTLPFPVTLYGRLFASASVSADGQMDFQAASDQVDGVDSVDGLPDRRANTAIFVHWDHLSITGPGGGIFTSTGTDQVTGHTTFTVEWRATYVDTGESADFALRLYENSPRFDIVFGQVDETGSFATVGVQDRAGNSFTQYEGAQPDSLLPGLELTFQPAAQHQKGGHL